ncbi:MAG: hypothetical protein ACTSRK_15715 [Promethearchaeota archaeon]
MNSPKQRNINQKGLELSNRRNSKILIALLVIFVIGSLASGVEFLKIHQISMNQKTLPTEAIPYSLIEKIPYRSGSLKGDSSFAFGNVGDDQELSTQILHDLYGFEIILPGNCTSFQDLPVLAINISNEELIDQSSYMFRIGNLTEGTIYNDEFNVSSGWFPFAPNENASVTEINNVFSDFWLHTAENVPIAIEFFINNDTVNYITLIYKDLTPPEDIVGFSLTDDNIIIPMEMGTLLFNSAPTIFFNITDNVPNNVSLSLMINNRIYLYSVPVHNPNVDPIVGDLFYNRVINITILTEGIIWQDFNDGNITIAYSFIDAADNPTEWKFLSFIKDTVSPHLDSGIPDRSWLTIRDYAGQTSTSPFGENIEVSEPPQFQITLYDDDVKQVGLRILDISSINILDASNSSSNPSSSGFLPQSVEYEGSTYISGVKNGSSWIIKISPEIWESLDNNLIDMQFELEDFAGNLAIYSFSIMKIGDSLENNSTIVLFFGVSSAILVGLIIFGSIVSVDRRNKSFQIMSTNFNGLEQIDPDLLDLVLEPLDHVKLERVTDRFTREGKNFDPRKITELDLKEFLLQPLQLLHLQELRLLLTRYHMDPLDLEEFVHEMFAMSPLERREFILRYMESGKRKAPKSLRFGRGPTSLLPDSNVRLSKNIADEIWGKPETDIGGIEEDLMGEEEDPWTIYESLPNQENLHPTGVGLEKSPKDNVRKGRESRKCKGNRKSPLEGNRK